MFIVEPIVVGIVGDCVIFQVYCVRSMVEELKLN